MSAGANNPLWLRIAVPVVALYALLGYLLLPWTLQQLAPRWVAEALDARLEIGDIHFDPFRLRLLIFEPRLVGPIDNEHFAAENIIGAGRVEAQLLLRSLWQLSPVIALELEAPRLHVERAANGSINLTALILKGPTPAEGAETSELPSLGLQRLLISDGHVTLLDHSRPEPFRSSFEDIELDLRELWLPSGEPAPIWAAMHIEGASLDVRGHIEATPELELSLTWVDLPLDMAERWLAGAGPVDRLRGRLHGSGRLKLGNDGIPRLAAGALHLHGLDVSLPSRLAIAGTDLEARLRQIRLDEMTGSLWPLNLDLGHLSLRQGHVGIRYGMRDPAAALSTDEPDPADPADQEGPAPALRLRQLEVMGIDVAATDASLPLPARLDVGLRRLGAENLHWPADPEQTAAIAAEMVMAPNADSDFAGNLDLAAARLQGRLESRRLPLPAFAPWLHAFTRLGLESGEFSQQSDFDLHWSAQPIDLRVLLDAQIEDLSIADPDGIDLIAWDRLDLRGLEFDLAKRRLALVEVALATPTVRFARMADGRTNLAGIGAVTEDDSDTSEDPAPAAAQDPAWNWELSRFTVDAGTLDFIDETLVIPFATRVEALSGSVDDLSSVADSLAALRLDGRIPPTGSARIEARGQAMDPFANTELTLNFRGVPMPRMTPWTGTFAGYRIAGGRLDLDLTYQIDQGALDARNKLTMNAMRLGEPMDSPRAMDLPLRLAVALLRDSDDNITLDIPVSGDVDDPQFNLRPAIMQAVSQILTNIVTAPFRLLAGLVGGSSEAELDRVVYALGSAELADDQEKQLLILERALGQRPALGLQLPAVHAGDADRAALRADALERELAERSEDRGAALKMLFRERHGDEEFEALLAVHSEAEAAPENPPAVASETGSSGTLFTEIENRLLGGIVVSDEELEALARRRAETVYLYLSDAGLDSDRIRIDAQASEVELAGEQVPLSFELDALEP